VSATPPFWNNRGLHDGIRRVLNSDRIAETIPTRRRRWTANAGELTAEAGEIVNPKWTTIRLHGGHTARICEVLTADTPRNRASVLFLFTPYDCPFKNCRILALTCHHRSLVTFEKGITVPEDWRL
jgi:hypothetical protein